MNIDVVRHIPFSELEAMVRRVPLKKRADDGSEITVYKDARIRRMEYHPEDVNPTTFYLLRGNLDFQGELHVHLYDRFGIDTLNLDGAVELHNKDTGKLWTLTPPIVEVTPRTVKYVPQEGEIEYTDSMLLQIPIIMDGAHRVGLASKLGRTFTAVFIAGADPRFPFYAHPNPWHMVRIVDEVPKTKDEKKWYRMPDCYAVYRDFDVIGCGAPRGVSQ